MSTFAKFVVEKLKAREPYSLPFSAYEEEYVGCVVEIDWNALEEELIKLEAEFKELSNVAAILRNK